MSSASYRFATRRLLVNEWHDHAASDAPPLDLPTVVQGLLTPRVTQSLPPDWQGAYSFDRARNWIEARDRDGATLLVTERTSAQPVGLIILFDTAPEGAPAEFRLGYFLAESAWRKGFASELVSGFVEWCQQSNVASITGGVGRDNPASRRVLEKCGFVCNPNTEGSEEQIFSLNLQ